MKIPYIVSRLMDLHFQFKLMRLLALPVAVSLLRKVVDLTQVFDWFSCVLPAQSPITVYIDPAGWAWLVHERRLLVWRYLSTERSKVCLIR